VRIVYTTRGDPRYLRHCSFIGSEDFIKKYPQITQRVVNTLVKAAKWMSDQEANPSVAYQLWTKSGVRFADYREDWAGQSLKVFASPLLDPYLVSQYKYQVKQAKKFGLIKKDVDVDAWIEPRFLKQALKELSLENFWTPVGEDGVVPKAAASAPAPTPAGAQTTAAR
jgi:sulfonate transport system substrate-binding protein